MKVFLGLLLATITLASQEIPVEIKKEIENNVRNSGGNYREQQRELEWIKNSYFGLEKKLKESELTQEEQNKIKLRLSSMYGYNYIQQNIKVKTEISDYKDLKAMAIAVSSSERIEKEKIKLNERNSDSEVKVLEILKETKIPTLVMERLKSESERLYPGNYYEQERYLESSIENYEVFKKKI